MNWIILLFALEVGMVSENSWIMYDPPTAYVMEQPQYYTQLEGEVQLFDNHFFIGGEAKTRMWKNREGYTFWPFVDEYKFGTGFRWGPTEIGMRHLCTHPVVPYMEIAGYEPKYDGGYDEFYIRLEIKR